jgi:hypothetical protein
MDLTQAVSHETGLGFDEIHSYGKQSEVTRARKRLIQMAVKAGHPKAEISRAMVIDRKTVVAAAQEVTKPVFRSVRA